MITLSSRVAVGTAGCLLWISATAGAGQEPPTATEVEETVDVIRETYLAAQEALKELPKERFDPLVALEAANFEPQAIAAWVEQNTRWVPYPGVLRGARGVLLDRQGNSLDRSLLLADLLEEAGYDARLVRGRLSAEAVARLLSRPSAGPAPAEASQSTFKDEIRAAANRAIDDARALAELVSLPDGRGGEWMAEVAADHWWVEAEVGSAWTSFDPLLDGPLAELRPEAVERVALGTVPESLFHEVTLRVVVERWDAGQTVEETPLEHTLRTASGLYHDLELQFVPFAFDRAPEGADALAEARAVAETTQEWLPLLRQGREQVRQQGFDHEGNLERNPDRPVTNRKMEAATSALSALGRSSEPVKTQLSACWLDYEIMVPGETPRVVRRELFDLIGPARRRSGDVGELAVDAAAMRERGRSLMGMHRILITGADLPPVAFERAALELWGRQGPQIAALIRLLHNPNAAEPLQRLHSEPLVALDLLGLAAARRDLSPHRAATFTASANILSTHFLVEIEDSFVTRRGYDLVANEVGVTASGPLSASRIRLEQGVLDTALEAALSERGETPDNTAELFSLRGAQTGEWRLADADSEATALPEQARARMAQAVAAGRLVVAPEKLAAGIEPAWWEIDPVTGTTLGIGSRGWGQALEYGTNRNIQALSLNGVRQTGIRAGCKVLGAYLRMAGMMTRSASGGWAFSAEAVGLILQHGCGGSPLLVPH